MKRRPLKTVVIFFEALLVFVFANGLFAQTRPRSTGPANTDLLVWRAKSILSAYQSASQQAVPQGQTISQTGLLPLFVIDMDIDASWVDGDAAPSNSPQFSHSGVSDALDQAWTTLKPAGFNAIRFPVGLDDPKSPVRVANLCLWAKANGVTLIPILQGTKAMRDDSSAMASALGTFITSVISPLRAGDGSALPCIAQISSYQLERPMNHAGLYPKTQARSAQRLLLAASTALRQGETQALQGTGVQATPISIGASFDFELIQQGAIAGIPLDPGAEQRAQDSLKQYLKGFASTNIDAINVEWYPRSFSSGDADHFVTLLRALKQSFPERQFTLTTGFSSAFNTPDQALQFYAAAISSLGGLRASEGVDSKFVGIVFQQAFKGTNADTAAPAGTPDPSQWKWADRAQQLLAMWSRGKTSTDMAWWVSKVQDNMGMVALQPNANGAPSVTPLPALQTLEEISSALTQATQQVQAPASTPTATDSASQAVPATTTSAGVAPAIPGYVPGAQPSAQAASSPFQQLMISLLQQFTQQMAAKLMEKIGGPNQRGGYVNPAYAGVSSTNPSAFVTPTSSLPQTGQSSFANTVWIGPSDINVSTTSPAAGQTVAVTAQLHNQSSDQDISGLTLQLVNPTNPAAASQSVQGGITVPRSGVTPVQLSWTPDATTAGQVQLLLQALDSSGQMITSVAMPGITIQGPSNSAATGVAGGFTTNGTAASSTSVGSNANSAMPNTSDGSTTPAGSTIATGPAPVPQLTVNGFGLADPSASGAGQIPQLQAQVSNSSQAPTQSGQAQLFLDSTPQQMQVIGSVLPSGTLTLQFQPIQTTAGQHNLQLVVTTADGASASATFTASVTAAGTSSSGKSTPPNTQTTGGTARSWPPRTVRAVVTTNFQIANVRATTSLPKGVIVPSNPSATMTMSTPATNQQPPSFQTPSATGTGTRTLIPQRAQTRTITPATLPATTSTGATQTSPALRVPAVRTLTPGSTQSTAGNTQTSTGSQVPTVRTLTPGSTQSTAGNTQTSTGSQVPAVRTLTPSSTQSTAGNTQTSTGSQVPAVRTLTPSSTQSTAGNTQTNTGSQVPAVRTLTPATATMAAPRSSGSVGQSFPPAKTNTGAPAAFRPAATTGVLDLAIAAQDLHLMPVPPRAGQTTMFTAAIKNTGTVPAQGASVVFVLLANGQRLAWSQPMTFNLPPRGVFQARWSTPLPAVAGQQIMVSVTVIGDSNPANNQVVVPFSVALAPAKAPLKPR